MIRSLKRFSVIATLCLAFVLIMICVTHVKASTSDVKGIDSGKEYYIKNTYNGKYLEVYNGTDVNGTAVVANTFTGSNAQKWRVEKKSDGYYRIYAVVSSSNRVLDRNASNVDIWTYDSGMACQKFTLVRDTSTSYYAGTYQIKNSGDYLCWNSTGSNVWFSSSGSGAGALWSFEPVVKGSAEIYTFYYPDGSGYYNSRGAAGTFTSVCGNLGYSANERLNQTAIYAANHLKEDSIWVFRGHGVTVNETPLATVVFKNSSGNDNGHITANSSIFNGSQDVAIDSMTANVLANARCVLYVGCSTGVSYNGYNLVDSTFNKGAHFALGTCQDILTVDGTNWTIKFFEKANTGANIRQCYEYASYYQNIGALYSRGDTFATLK